VEINISAFVHLFNWHLSNMTFMFSLIFFVLWFDIIAIVIKFRINGRPPILHRWWKVIVILQREKRKSLWHSEAFNQPVSLYTRYLLGTEGQVQLLNNQYAGDKWVFRLYVECLSKHIHASLSYLGEICHRNIKIKTVLCFFTIAMISWLRSLPMVALESNNCIPVHDGILRIKWITRIFISLSATFSLAVPTFTSMWFT
jgi:hypothetical protein